MSTYSNRLVAFFILTISASLQALAETPETCLISPNPPGFTSDNTDNPLHALPHPQVGMHTQLHGQGLYGTDTLYFSHLAVFMGRPDAHPHNFQVILEVELENPQAKQQYQTDKAQHQGVIYVATRLHAADTLTCSLETGTRAPAITVELRISEEPYCEAGEFVQLVTTQFNRPQRCQG